MDKLILGLSTVSHDCSYAISNAKGDILSHCELERDTRIKEAKGSPLLYFLSDERSAPYLKNIKVITSIAELSPVLSSISCLLKDGLKENIVEAFYSSNLSITPSLEGKISKKLVISSLRMLMDGIEEVKIYGHHACHAAEAWGSFNYRRNDENIIFTIDGGGYDLAVNSIDLCKESILPHDYKVKESHVAITRSSSEGLGETIYQKYLSFASIYNLITNSLGFSTGSPNGSQQGSVMGLAAYGSPELYQRLFDNDFLWMNTARTNEYREEVLKAGNVLKKIIADLKINCDWTETKADLAASLQNEFEKRLIDFIKSYIDNLRENSKNDSLKISNVLLSGGCSLNCAAVGRLTKILKSIEAYSKINVYVSPVPYDGGLCLGSIFSYLNEQKLLSRDYALSPYLGHLYSKGNILNSIDKYNLEYSRCDKKYITQLLAEGNVIAIFNGRSESGRRALGNRSILADPRNPNIRYILNKKVKHRPLFRPFAPVILREKVNEWFEMDVESPYMSHAIPFRPEKAKIVPSVVHKDGTGRLQTVTKEQNPWIYDLLMCWEQTTQCPLLINTSFNDNEPIVESPDDALRCFSRTSIDYLVFPDVALMVSKEKERSEELSHSIKYF